MTHQHLSFQGLHSFKGNAHNDDDGSTADCQVLDAGQQITGDQRQQCNHRQIECTEAQDHTAQMHRTS